MSRKPRKLQGNLVYHVFNRRTDRQCLFPVREAYEDFLRVLERAKVGYDARLHAYCLMTTHIHLAVSAEDASVLQKYLQWVSTTHAVRFRFQTETRGDGHVYQDRYKSKAVEDAVHYATLVKYIEANALTAGVVRRAEDWRWSSLHERVSNRRRLTEPGPWTLPDNWLEVVNTPDVAVFELAALLGQLSSFRPQATAFPELL